MIYKGYEIRPHVNNPKSYIIITPGKAGKIPNLLQGMFTDRGIAKQVIDSYLETKGA
jgi:hypothetical protein